MSKTIEANIMGVVRLLAYFCETGDVASISEARKKIQAIANVHAEIALPLWELTINLQRSRLDTGDAA